MVSWGISAWTKHRSREILKSPGRYLAILTIVALGVGLFSGLKITMADMHATADKYIGDYKLYDYRLISTLGLTEEDVENISKLEGVKDAVGAYEADFIAALEGSDEIVLKAHSITSGINLPNLTAGRLPAAPDECLVDAYHFGEEFIGKKIAVSDENSKETASKFAYSEYQIVGLARSPLYLGMERGTTSLAGGRVSAFVLIPPKGFATDYFTDIYVLLDESGYIYSDEYKAAAEKMKQPLTDAIEERGLVLLKSIKDEAYAEIAEVRAEYEAALAEYQAQKADAEREVEMAREALADAAGQLESKERELADGAAKLEQAKRDYESGLSAYTEAAEQLAAEKASAEAQFSAAQAEIDQNRAALEGALIAAQEAGEVAQIEYLNAQLAELEELQAELDAQKAQSEEAFHAAEAQLAETKAQLDASAAAIAAAERELDAGREALNSARMEYEKNLQELAEAEEKSQKGFAEAEDKLAKAKAEIDEAMAEIDAISPPDVYVLGRDTNAGYTSFENDSAIVDGISKVFPVFFFLVAALVCTTTMARMVEEQRMQIGTLKALGYSDGAVIMKYVSYAASASLIGCLIGYFGGTRLFPYVIWTVYGILYGFAPLVFTDHWELLALSLLVSLACTEGVTFLTCRAELFQMPARLMRPKAPKPGKRVFLERIGFIWNRMNFMQKISMRNIFRYKKRLLMMVLGIGGCMALLITGFGIRDSISGIAHDQFGTIMKYDLDILLGDAMASEEIEEFKESTADFLSNCVFVCPSSVEVPTGKGVKSANVIATGDPAITELINLRRGEQQLDFPPDGEVTVSDKIASIAEVEPGDSLAVRLSDGTTREVKIHSVFENHAFHYLLMTPATYEAIFGRECEYTAVLANAEDDPFEAAARLQSEFDVKAVTVTEEIRRSVDNMMKTLNYVVYVVILCAAALAFVVLFNLSNINITERVREIATIKVLGFYPHEVGAYVFRENIVLTVGGVLAGIPLGIWLHRFVMSQIDIDIVSFNVRIFPTSFIVSAIITLCFDIIVDLLMRRKLSAINMVESLKAVE